VAYTSTRGDIGAEIGDIMCAWLPKHLKPDNATRMEMSGFSAPDAGYSGKTVFFTATWTDPQGHRRSQDLVLRLQAKDHQLFTTPNAPRQAEVMRSGSMASQYRMLSASRQIRRYSEHRSM